jgi:hypothetical protein
VWLLMAANVAAQSAVRVARFQLLVTLLFRAIDWILLYGLALHFQSLSLPA